MKCFVILLSLLLIALVPINAQQPVILPEPVPIEEEELPVPTQEAPVPQQPELPHEPALPQTEEGSVLDVWESASNAMLQSESVISWIPLCCSAVLNTIPYIPGLVAKAMRLLPLSCIFAIRAVRAMPSLLRSAWSFLCALPYYIRSFIDLAQQMIELLTMCIRILPQIMSSQPQQQGGQPSLAQLLPLLRALMG